MKIKFQVILKKTIYPEYYLVSKLYPIIEAESSAIGDFDIETVKSWISIDYYTSYSSVENRKLLGFTVDLPFEEEFEDFGRKILDTADNSLSSNKSFALELQNDTEVVEAVLRYEDEYILKEYKKYQPQIFEIEMQIREVLNYILSFNLANNDINSFLNEFENYSIPNEKLRNNTDFRNKRSKEYYENELFWVVFTSYGAIHPDKQKKPKPDDIIKQIQIVNTFEELKNLFYKISFSNLNDNHLSFVNAIQKHLNPIELMRNEIMHTRKPTSDNESAYQKAYGELKNEIIKFWEIENSQLVDIKEIRNALINIFFNQNTFEYLENDNVKFKDLFFEEHEEWVEDFKSLCFEQISSVLFEKYNHSFTSEEEKGFYEILEHKIESLVMGQDYIS